MSLAAAMVLAGCAVSNYDFSGVSDQMRGSARAEELTQDLATSTEDRAEGGLYDLKYFPLARLKLNVFAQPDDQPTPDGYAEAEFESWLPLFGFFNASLDLYGADLLLLEHHDLKSRLWGLYQLHREEIATPAGLRVQNQRRLLWVLSWAGRPRYEGKPEPDPAPAESG